MAATSFNLLTNTSKMPGKSFSLPAMTSCPWAVTIPKADGSPAVCAGCYALSGQYRMPNVTDTQAARFAWVRECMRNAQGQRQFEEAMIDAVQRLRPKPGDKHVYFRIHDAGDFFSSRYVESWVRICQALPAVRFWAPTRSYLAIDSSPLSVPRIVSALHQLNDLPNVTVRPSATHFGNVPPRVHGLAAGSTSGGKADYDCPAYKQDGKCGKCRVCWDKPEVSVNYHVHGQEARKLVRIAGVEQFKGGK